MHILATLLGAIIWLYLLSVCKRGDLSFYHFLIGSIGLFILCMFQLPYYEHFVISGLVYLMSPIGALTGMFQSFPHVGAFLINNNQTAMSFYIDIECSGIIEMLVFVCLVLFFDIYTKKEKVLTSCVGVALIVGFNCIRMLCILTIIHFGGPNYYLISHSVVGRIVFYVLTIILYYKVFTKKQIDRQKVGDFAYDSSISDQ